MQRMKSVTSAENLLQLLRSGRESQDAPRSLVDPRALTQGRELPMTAAALEAHNNSEARILDAALDLLEQPLSLLVPSISIGPQQSLPLPGELLQRDIPLAALQGDKLLVPGFAPVSDWDRGQGPGNSAGDEQTGSDDTHQDAVRGGGGSGRAAVRPVQVKIRNVTAKETRQVQQRNQQQQQQTSGRPQRQTAKRALEKLGSTHQSLADDDDEEDNDNKDGLSDTEDVSDAAFMSHGKRGRFSSGAQSFRTSSPPADSAGGGGGGSRGNRKQSGRPLQRKSYDALVDPTLPPEEIRRIRRILSNRESARRSRKRKATQMSALEDELMEVNMAATELENELIEALTTARALEMDRSQLMAEVDMLKRKLAAYEGGAPVVVAHNTLIQNNNNSTVNKNRNTASFPKAASVAVPQAVPPPPTVNVPVSILPPQQQQQQQQQQLLQLQHQLSLPPLPPIKIPTSRGSAPPILSLPRASSTPTVAATATTTSPTESQGMNTRRASPPNTANGTHTRSSPHFQSPLKQVGSHVSHRVRFKPVPPPSFFPDVMGEQLHHHEDVHHGMLL